MGRSKAKLRATAERSSLPARFTPKFWELADLRSGVTKIIRRRYLQLKDDAGVDSIQKDMLVQRAIFISTRLETLEIEAAESGEFDPGVYTNLTNTLTGLLKAIGLEKKIKSARTLEQIKQEFEQE